MCELHGTECVYERKADAQSRRSGPQTQGSERRRTRKRNHQASEHSDDQTANLHIVGPAVAKDSQILSEYLSEMPNAPNFNKEMVVRIPVDRAKYVLFTRVKKRPVGMSRERSTADRNLEIIEKILGTAAPLLMHQ